MRLLDEKLSVVPTENKAIIKEGHNVWYIRAINHSLYNPYDLSHKARIRKTKFIKVNKTTYDLYLKFLSTKMLRYKTQAERNK